MHSIDVRKVMSTNKNAEHKIGIERQKEKHQYVHAHIFISYFRFAIPLGALYVRNYFQEETREAATNLVKSIQNVFIEMIEAASWMDTKTREQAIKKAKALKIHIGYQNELEDWLLSLDTEYNDLEIKPNDFLSNILRMEMFEIDYLFNTLHEPIHKNESDTLLNPVNVNAHYTFTENAILFPAAILQDRFFSIEHPNYMNYAGIGSLIGHEITHGTRLNC